MQNIETNSNIQEARSMQMLKTGLEELNMQVPDNDMMEEIAKKAKCHVRTVRRYLRKKKVAKYKVGKKILDKGRLVVIAREQTLKVA